MATAISHYDKILARRDRGEFACALRVKSTDAHLIFEGCMIDRAMAKIFLAQEKRRWEELKATCEEIQRDEALVQLINKSKYKGLVEAADRMTNDMAIFLMELQVLDIHMATKRLDKMRQDKNCPQSPAMLNYCGELLQEVAFTIIMQGPDAAKAVLCNRFPNVADPPQQSVEASPLVRALA
jgi:hypothetical protein